MNFTAAVSTFVLVLGVVVRAEAQGTFDVKRGPGDATSSKEARVRKAIEEIERTAAKAGPEQEAIDEVFLRSQSAIKRLGRAGTDAIPQIEAVLLDSGKDWKTKAMLCEALGQIDDEKSVALLGRIVPDASQPEFVRGAAGYAAASIRRPSSEEIVKRVVADKTLPLKIRARTMMAVGQTGIDDVEWLAALAGGSWWPKGKEISQEEFGLILNAQRALGASTNPKATDKLMELVDRYPSNTILVEELGKKRDPRAVPVLIRTLEKKEVVSTAQHHAAIALGEMKATKAVKPLSDVVKNHPNPLLAVKAAEALAKIGDKQALEALQNVVDGLRSDPRFNESGGIYWKQEQSGWGPITALKKALADLKAK